MNYIKHLTGFFEKVANDRLLNPTHISLYMALFQGWNCNRFRNPISISRDEIMRISKISSKATYHKCLKNLHTQSYIKYEPSFNPFRGSHVYMFNFADELRPMTKSEKSASLNFEPVVEQVVNKSQTSNGTGNGQVIEQVLVPYINNTNITNSKNVANGLNGSAAEKNKNEFSDFKKNNDKKESSAKEKSKKATGETKSFPRHVGAGYAGSVPTIEDVHAYFLEQSFSELEARKFYNHYASNGWLVGGKSPMVEWTAAAQNWMINAPNFQNTAADVRPQHLNVLNTKDYSEPL